MRIMLTGVSGQLGFELRRALSPLGEIVALDRQACDLSRPEDLPGLIREIKPSIIVNPAAYTAVDKAESDIETAHRVNAVAPGILGQEAAKIGAVVVHYSTDYVFDGNKKGAYNEEDLPNPQGQYGKSKLAGERALAASGANYLIFRTSWVVGAFGANFAKTMLRVASERDSLRVVDDQYGAPTGSALIADVTAQILGQYAGRADKSSFPFGLYHLSAKGLINWHGYAQYVLKQAEANGKTLRVAAEAVEAIPSSAYPLPAVRPKNSQLDSSRLENNFGLRLPDWQPGIEHVLKLIC